MTKKNEKIDCNMKWKDKVTEEIIKDKNIFNPWYRTYIIYSSVTTENGVSATNSLSAESVAISLLKKFSEKQLPKASDLIWLVPESDAPQKVIFLFDFICRWLLSSN